MAKNKKEETKKGNKILLIIFGVIIVLLLLGLFILNEFYFSIDEHSIDYLKLKTKNNNISEENSNELFRDDGKCSIVLMSRIEEESSLSSKGEVIDINGHKWAKQEFDNGISWMSYYKNTFYLIQMFGKDKEIYESDCKKDFDKIKDSFTFMKNE